MKTKLILVGGFLGSGKTTLLQTCAKKIKRNIALITNDQVAELVDTKFLNYANDVVLEVSGSCFCCNFSGFSDALLRAVNEYHSEIILAEPVGSCTDISATIIQPLKRDYNNIISVAPFSVLIDPSRLKTIIESLPSGLHSSTDYIIRKQLEEADIIVISKSDTIKFNEIESLTKNTSKIWPLAKLFVISSNKNEGIDQWLEYAMSSEKSGTKIIDVDYDIYAEGEAVLGWLNASFKLTGKNINWNSLFELMINSLSNRLDSEIIEVGHIKMLLENESGYYIGNVTGKADTIKFKGSPISGNEVNLILNARVQMEPAKLEKIIIEEFSTIFHDYVICEIIQLKCIKPGYPSPTFKYDCII